MVSQSKHGTSPVAAERVVVFLASRSRCPSVFAPAENRYHKRLLNRQSTQKTTKPSAHAPTIHLRNARRLASPSARRSCCAISTCRSSTGPRSAWSAKTGRASRRCCKIMAGLDKDFDGTANLAKGMRVRYVAQEPQLDLDKTVRENLLLGHEADPGPGRPLQRNRRPHGRSRSRTTTSTSSWTRWAGSRSRSTPAAAGSWTG